MAAKLLVIEDDATSLRLIEYTLKQRGYTVITARNGLEGIIAAQKEAPDLIILDIMLPGIDGYEVCKRLRGGAQTAKTPILIVSGKIQKEDINTGFKAGADDYLCKPAPPSEIIGRVEALLCKKNAGQCRSIVFVNISEMPGVPAILANLAAALAEPGKQVTLLDVPADVRPPKSPPAAAAVPENRAAPGYEALPSGVRVFHTDPQENGGENAGAGLLQKISRNSDFILVDLPLYPSAFAAAMLKNCSLAVIVSDYRLANLAEIRYTVTLFRFLGMKPEQMAAVLVDPAGDSSGLTLDNIKPYIEANLGIALAEVVAGDAKSAVPAGQETRFAKNIRQIARFITTCRLAGAEAAPAGAAAPERPR